MNTGIKLYFCAWDTGADRKRRPDCVRVRWDNRKEFRLCAQCRKGLESRFEILAPEVARLEPRRFRRCELEPRS